MKTLLVSMIGLLILSSIMLFQKPTNIKNDLELISLEENRYVCTVGKITALRAYGSEFIVELDNKIEAIVDQILRLNSNISICGAIIKYQNKSKIQVDKFEIYS